MKKCVLVTGAYGGMGKATVQALKNKGYSVFALDKRVEASEEDIYPICADLTSDEGVDAALAEVQGHTDRLFAVVHFAGTYMLDSLIEMSIKTLEDAFRINFFIAARVNKAFLPLLKKGSRILITTSELAPLAPLPFTGVYAVTKAALDKYAYSLAMEVQLLGVSVSVLRAGAVNTDMLGASTAALDRFCERTELYTPNAARFKRIVERVEARHIPPERLARRAIGILEKKRPRFAYAINRNPLLLLLNALPKRLQLWAIKNVLK